MSFTLSDDKLSKIFISATAQIKFPLGSCIALYIAVDSLLTICSPLVFIPIFSNLVFSQFPFKSLPIADINNGLTPSLNDVSAIFLPTPPIDCLSVPGDDVLKYEVDRGFNVDVISTAVPPTIINLHDFW